jgi:hypothetical protein
LIAVAGCGAVVASQRGRRDGNWSVSKYSGVTVFAHAKSLRARRAAGYLERFRSAACSGRNRAAARTPGSEEEARSTAVNSACVLAWRKALGQVQLRRNSAPG